MGALGGPLPWYLPMWKSVALLVALWVQPPLVFKPNKTWNICLSNFSLGIQLPCIRGEKCVVNIFWRAQIFRMKLKLFFLKRQSFNRGQFNNQYRIGWTNQKITCRSHFKFFFEKKVICKWAFFSNNCMNLILNILAWLESPE